MRAGTHHFKSIRDAVLYYRVYNPGLSSLGLLMTVKEMTVNGDAVIGPPTPKPGERITLDRDGRYWIEDDA